MKFTDDFAAYGFHVAGSKLGKHNEHIRNMHVEAGGGGGLKKFFVVGDVFLGRF